MNKPRGDFTSSYALLMRLASLFSLVLLLLLVTLLLIVSENQVDYALWMHALLHEQAPNAWIVRSILMLCGVFLLVRAWLLWRDSRMVVYRLLSEQSNQTSETNAGRLRLMVRLFFGVYFLLMLAFLGVILFWLF